jgi:putative FmdB family regulatory protein
MPVYEYSCQDCGKKFDTLRSMKDADQPIPCKGCQSQHTRRMLSKCYSQGDRKNSVTQSGGCGGCSGGSSCGSCHR